MSISKNNTKNSFAKLQKRFTVFIDNLKRKHLIPQKTTPQMVVGALIFLLLIVGSASAMLLSSLTQDIRQQAAGDPYSFTCTQSGYTECRNGVVHVCTVPGSPSQATSEACGDEVDAQSCEDKLIAEENNPSAYILAKENCENRPSGRWNDTICDCGSSEAFCYSKADQCATFSLYNCSSSEPYATYNECRKALANYPDSPVGGGASCTAREQDFCQQAGGNCQFNSDIVNGEEVGKAECVNTTAGLDCSTDPTICGPEGGNQTCVNDRCVNQNYLESLPRCDTALTELSSTVELTDSTFCLFEMGGFSGYVYQCGYGSFINEAGTACVPDPAFGGPEDLAQVQVSPTPTIIPAPTPKVEPKAAGNTLDSKDLCFTTKDKCNKATEEHCSADPNFKTFDACLEALNTNASNPIANFQCTYSGQTECIDGIEYSCAFPSATPNETGNKCGDFSSLCREGYVYNYANGTCVNTEAADPCRNGVEFISPGGSINGLIIPDNATECTPAGSIGASTRGFQCDEGYDYNINDSICERPETINFCREGVATRNLEELGGVLPNNATACTHRSGGVRDSLFQCNQGYSYNEIIEECVSLTPTAVTVTITTDDSNPNGDEEITDEPQGLFCDNIYLRPITCPQAIVGDNPSVSNPLSWVTDSINNFVDSLVNLGNFEFGSPEPAATSFIDRRAGFCVTNPGQDNCSVVEKFGTEEDGCVVDLVEGTSVFHLSIEGADAACVNFTAPEITDSVDDIPPGFETGWCVYLQTENRDSGAYAYCQNRQMPRDECNRLNQGVEYWTSFYAQEEAPTTDCSGGGFFGNNSTATIPAGTTQCFYFESLGGRQECPGLSQNTYVAAVDGVNWCVIEGNPRQLRICGWSDTLGCAKGQLYENDDSDDGDYFCANQN